MSNLAWPSELEAVALKRLATLGVHGVEVAPTRLAAWEAWMPALLAEYRSRVADAGLAISSLQAILFGRDELQLLGGSGSFDALCEHLRRVTEVAAALGAGVLVFGSPRNRQRGGMSQPEAWKLARTRLRLLGEIVAVADVRIGIEPVPPFYGSEFLTMWTEVLRMVREVDHPAIRVHLDTGCVALGGDSIAEAITASAAWLAHFQAAQPELGGFANPAPNHQEAATALEECGYDGWLAIEMREQSADALAEMEVAVLAVQRIYGLPHAA